LLHHPQRTKNAIIAAKAINSIRIWTSKVEVTTGTFRNAIASSEKLSVLVEQYEISDKAGLK
ncbi:hypothetical protein T05_5235, partial [Trichinella murrelli]